MCRKITFAILGLFPALLAAQQKSDLQQVLDRLDRIEQENKTLADEVRALRPPRTTQQDSIVNVRGLEAIPPGLSTVTVALPGDAIRLAGTEAFNWLPLT